MLVFKCTINVTFKHLLQPFFFFFLNEKWFFSTVPAPYGPIMRSCHDKIPTTADCKTPYLCMMSFKSQKQFKLICVPVFQKSVFSNTEHIMSIWDKLHIHYTVSMGKYGFMAVAKVQTPNFQVLVGRTSNDQVSIR
uniref:Uncharacterized protein n=1 Tax=Opuntia streptacantha TaxID=393608 RepID=A0A7C9AQ99_OPUST